MILCWLSYPAEKDLHRPVFINLRNLCVQKCRLFPVQLRRQCSLDNFRCALFKAYATANAATCDVLTVLVSTMLHASGCNLETCRLPRMRKHFPEKFKTSNPIGQNVRVPDNCQLSSSSSSARVYRYKSSRSPAMLDGGRLLKPVRKIKRQAVTGEGGDRRRGWRQVSYARLGCRGISRTTLDRKRR